MTTQPLNPAWLGEGQRQARLLRALFADSIEGVEDLRTLVSDEREVDLGLAAYRNNAQATAVRALALAYPTIAALLGASVFARLAQSLWRSHPPRRGDLAHWGAPLPGLLRDDPQWGEWPYLADCAHLDWAIHEAESVGAPDIDVTSLHRLAGSDPAAIRLVLQPSLRVLRSAWPVLTIYQAHQKPGDTTRFDEQLMARAKQAIEAGNGENAVVVCHALEAQISLASDNEAQWMLRLQSGMSLGAALDDMAAARHDFDFSTWLVRALQQHWIWRVEFNPIT